MGVTLGGIFLDGFEVSARISFGGAQALAVHKLPGGSRVIDAMGQDDGLIGWHGILSGSDATDRARALDAIRAAGAPVPLAWDVFTATVIVSSLDLEYCNSWWIPYRVACTVLVGTQMAGAVLPAAGTLADVVADLAAAASAGGVAQALAAVNGAGATVPGSQAYAAAVQALSGAQESVAPAIAGADAQMGGADLTALTQTSGTLATLSAAAGYIGRAAANFQDAGF